VRVLLVAAGLPFPSDTGGKIRTINTLRPLMQCHDVTMVALVPPGADERAVEDTRAWAGRLVTVPWAETAKGTAAFYAELGVNLASRLPYVVAKHSSRRMREVLAALEGDERFDALICDFLFPAINTFHLRTRPRVLFQHNLETRIWERYVATETARLRRSYFDLQRRRLARFERLACSTYDHCVAVSEADAEAMLRDFDARAASTIPTGVDLDYFAPQAERGEGIVFVGSMDWMPNQDAVRYFVNDILPLVRREEPDVRLTIVGRSAPADIVDLSRTVPGVEVTGFVEDVRPYIARAAVVVVPLRVGSGTRIKIYEAMAMGKPVISTTIGVEGLPVRGGSELLIADSADAFARDVTAVLRRPDLQRDLGSRARAYVVEHCSWDGAARRFVEIVESAVAQARAGNAPAGAGVGG
jgi:sugar transferase (PEP-CTERM/EpsH1 system associated)